MNKPIKPNITIPESFAKNGIKTDFDNDLMTEGFDSLKPDVLAGDNLNKFIDDTYKGLNYGMAAADAINLINEGETLTVVDGQLTSGATGGSGLEVGDIGMALYVDETKGLRRYLNGQIVDINTNTQAFLNRLKDITTLHPSLLCTEDEWQTEKTMSAFGQVGKFVFNYSGDEVVSVRLPRVVNVQGLFDLQNLGMTVAESLPNITGGFSESTYAALQNIGNGMTYGAFTAKDNSTQTGVLNVQSGSATLNQGSFYLDASRSSSTYKDNAPVQQEAIQYPYFIQIATGSETEANIVNTLENVNGFTLLESKYSDKPLYNESWLLSNGQWNAKAVYPTAYEGLQVEYNSEIEVGTTVTLPSGVSYTKRGLSVKLSTETYTDYDFVLNTAEETFRLPLKTNLASGKAVVGNGMSLGLKDASSLAGLGANTGTGILSGFKDYYGDPVGTTGASGSSFLVGSLGVTTDPTKSGMELSDSDLYLYFYVGETVQNANLIDAGRIGEQLATKTDMLQATKASMPSNRNTLLAWGANTTTYTAVADGWFVTEARINAGGFIALWCKATRSVGKCTSSVNRMLINAMCQVKKGDIVQLQYTNYASDGKLEFIYAEGEV